jgi:hypothetical protein
MATLPRYQKAGVQLQQMRELDQSGFREVAKWARQLLKLLGVCLTLPTRSKLQKPQDVANRQLWIRASDCS